jgi:hypothetical protein
LFYLPLLCLHPRLGQSLLGLATVRLQHSFLYSCILLIDTLIDLLLIPKVFGAEDFVHFVLNLFFVLVSTSTVRYCLLYNSEALGSRTKLIEIKLNFEPKVLKEALVFGKIY